MKINNLCARSKNCSSFAISNNSLFFSPRFKTVATVAGVAFAAVALAYAWRTFSQPPGPVSDDVSGDVPSAINNQRTFSSPTVLAPQKVLSPASPRTNFPYIAPPSPTFASGSRPSSPRTNSPYIAPPSLTFANGSRPSSPAPYGTENDGPQVCWLFNDTPEQQALWDARSKEAELEARLGPEEPPQL